MKSFFIVFFGGGLGSVVRYALGQTINSWHRQSFPWGTLTVNVAACFILGIIVGYAEHKQLLSPAAKLFWAVGFCGGFSTFSTFSNESLFLLQSGLNFTLVTYLFTSLILCITAVYGGIMLSQTL